MVYLAMDDKTYCEVYTCKQLWADVFRLGIVDANRQRKLAERGSNTDTEAIRWFNSEEVYPGSFIWLCHLFNLLPDRVRENAVNFKRGLSDEDLFA